MPNARILLVEDEAVVAMDVGDSLRRLGYTIVDVAADGETAVAAAFAMKPDLILMDIRLRGPMDGITAAYRIREQSEVPVIFLTAHSDPATVERLNEFAPHGYLVKPIEVADLGRAIDIALARRRAEEATSKHAGEALWKTNEQFRLLVDGVRDHALVLLDERGIIVSWNEGAERASGYKAEEVIGSSLTMLFPEESRDEMQLAHELAVARRDGYWIGEGWRLRKDGSRYWARSVRMPMVEPDGTLRGYGSVTHDLTVLHSLEAQLLKAQKLETLGQLVGGIAHDFNNMLMVIFGRVELLRRQITSPTHLKYLDDIREAADRNRALTRQLLASARRQVLQPEVVDLNHVLQSTMELLTPVVGEHISVRTELEISPWKVYADPAKLHQVILNLAVNASEAMPEGGALMIETRNFRADDSYARQRPDLPAGEYVQLVVSDTGVGMTPSVRDRIFDPFFTTKTAGSGLGLSVVRGIVEQTGGMVWVYSEPGQGTTFKIFFPRYLGTYEKAAPAEPESMPLRGTGTILLVEDETLVRTVISETLEENGYRVVQAASPRDAIRLSHSFIDPIDVLVTDIVLPEMNGRVLAEKLSAERPSMRVVYMSGYVDTAILTRGVLDATAHFVEKPATANALLRAISAALAEE